jgi:hypothetical protein
MSYLVVRIYSGSGARKPAELVQVAIQELAPQLAKQDGFLRYATFTLNDGRFGSTSLYRDRVSAERGLQVASEWVKSTGAMQGYNLARTLRGEQIFSFDGKDGKLQPGAVGTIRVFKTTASPAELEQGYEQEATPILEKMTGIQRYVVLALDEGGCAVIATHKDAKSLEDGARTMREHRQKSGSLAQKLLPNEPEVLQGVLAGTYVA